MNSGGNCQATIFLKKKLGYKNRSEQPGAAIILTGSAAFQCVSKDEVKEK